MCNYNNKIVVFDIETTGCNPENDNIIEIGAIKIIDDIIVAEWNELVNPCMQIPQNIFELTGISTEMVKDKATIDKLLPDFIKFCSGSNIMGHNIIFDYSFIKAKCIEYGYSFEKYAIDTLKISRKLLTDIPSRKLGELCKYYKINLTNAHRAKHDAKATYEVYKCMKEQFYNTNKEIFSAQKINWEPPIIEMITDRQKSYLLSLVRKHNVILDKSIDEFTRIQASKTIDQILKRIRS